MERQEQEEEEQGVSLKWHLIQACFALVLIALIMFWIASVGGIADDIGVVSPTTDTSSSGKVPALNMMLRPLF